MVAWEHYNKVHILYYVHILYKPALGCVLQKLLSQLAQYLGYEIRQSILLQSWKIFNDYVKDTYGGWREIVLKGIAYCINSALAALEAVRKDIVEHCCANEDLLKHLSKIAVKSASRLAAEVGAKSFVRVAAKKGAKQAAAQGVKTFAKVHPVGIAADVTQAGLEYMGYPKAGKTVGAGGNIASGVLLGAAVGGPPGAAIGAFGGFLIWGVGEVTGKLVDRAFGK